MKIKQLTVLIALVLTTMTGSVSAAEMISIKGDNVNMRSGPGKEYNIKMAYDRGFPLKMIKRDGKWVKVRDFEGDEGWIYNTLISKKQYVIVNSSKNIPVQKEPSDSSETVAKASRGVVLARLKTEGKWIKVQHESGVVGWIKKTAVWQGEN